MKKSGIIPSFLKYDNTSLRKLRTQALSDAGVDDWMISETIGHKDKKNTNLLYYRKMDHSDKLKMAQVLADPWKYSKKASLPNDINFPPFLFQSADKENLAPPAAKNSNRQMYLLLRISAIHSQSNFCPKQFSCKIAQTSLLTFTWQSK